MSKDSRERAIDAVDILNDFVGDFIVGTNVLREYASLQLAGKVSLEEMVPIQKMCISHIVLALAKYSEWWSHYQDLVPEEYRSAGAGINKEIVARRIVEFRNQCAGHIWDRRAQAPLKHSEIMSALETMMAPNVGAFLNWVNTLSGTRTPGTVVTIIEALRDSLMGTHGLEPEDIVHR